MDDAVGATACHLVCGMWGQLALGLFADTVSGPKGVFLGGSGFQLFLQAISVVALATWAGCATLVIICLVDQIMPIRLSPEDENIGADFSEHNHVMSTGQELARPVITLDKIISLSSPIEHKFTGTTDERSHCDLESFGRRKPYQVNHGFERNEHI